MEKTINFSGQDVRFRASMRTLLIYKAQTGREYLADVQKLSNIVVKGKDGKPVIGKDKKPQINLAALDTEMLCAVAWAMARTADKNVPPMDDWLDGFEEFPMLEILTELIPIINASLKVDAKNA